MFHVFSWQRNSDVYVHSIWGNNMWFCDLEALEQQESCNLEMCVGTTTIL